MIIGMRCVRQVLGTVLLGAVALMAGATGASGQTIDERVRRYDISIDVQADGSAEIREVLEYDFGSNRRRGIERLLVTTQRYDDDADRRYPLTVLDVEATAAPATYRVAALEGGVERIRVGDENTFVTGVHTYTLTYRLDGVVNAQPGDDELYWNVIGDRWQVPIEAVTVRVTVPGGATDVACFAGVTGTTATCDAATRDPATGDAVFSERSIAAGEGLTVVVAIPDTDGDDIEPQPVLRERRGLDDMFAVTPATVGITAVLAAIAAAAVASLQFLVGRDRRGSGFATDAAFSDEVREGTPVPLFDGTATPVEFVPPDKLRPAQLGVLLDEVADTRDVSSTIIDLAVRGWLRIEEVTNGRGKVTDYRLVDLHPSDDRPGLLEYERHLMSRLFAARGEVLLSDLKNQFATTMTRVKELLYVDAVARGWFLTRPDRVRRLWAAIGVAIGVVGGVITFVLAQFTSFALVGLPIVAAGLAVLVGAKWMPRRTPKGTGVLRRTKGFEDFIQNSEKHRAAFAERANLFTEYLPYAVMFGATDKWARTLAALGLPEPDTSSWYVGTAPIVWGSFGSRMNNFTSDVSTTLTSTPGGSGSSGFGGGGFSGGGGGGGGGGSW